MLGPDWFQESVALTVAGLSALGVVLRLSGVRVLGRKKPAAQKVAVGGRLARGLAAANDSRARDRR